MMALRTIIQTLPTILVRPVDQTDLCGPEERPTVAGILMQCQRLLKMGVLAIALDGQEKRCDLFLGAFLCEYFHMDVFGVMGGRAGVLGLVADLLIAAIDPGIKFGKSDAERLGDLLVALDCSNHGAGLDPGKRGLGDAGLLRDLDEREAFFLAERAYALP